MCVYLMMSGMWFGLWVCLRVVRMWGMVDCILKFIWVNLVWVSLVSELVVIELGLVLVVILVFGVRF